MKHKVSDWNGVNFGGEVLSGVVWCKWDVGGRGVECQRPLVEKRGQWESRLSYVHERNQLDTERERTAAERGFWPRDSRTAPLSLSTVPTRDGILQIHNGTLSSSTSVTSLHHIFFFLKGLFCLLRGGNFKFEKNKRFGQFFEKETLCRFAGNTLLFCLREREERERAGGEKSTRPVCPVTKWALPWRKPVRLIILGSRIAASNCPALIDGHLRRAKGRWLID